MTKTSIFPILTTLTHATCMCLILFTLISPTPFSISSVSLLKVEPFNLNSTTSTTSNATLTSSGLVFGGSSSSSSITSSSLSGSSATSSTESSHSRTSSSTSSSSTSVSIGSTPTPTSISERRFVVSRKRALRVREELANMTGPGGIYLNSAQQPMLSNDTSDSTTFSSKVQLTFGPLGSCFTDGNGNQGCTSSNLSPSYDTDALREKKFGGFITSGLLDRLPTTQILLLVVLVILILTLSLNILILLTKLIPSNPAISTFLEAGPRSRNLATIRQYSVYVSSIAWILLVSSTISMRIYSSKAVTSFNASNLSKALPPNLVLSDDGTTSTSNVLGLKAKLGSGFSMLWVTVVLMALILILERKGLKNGQAVAQARSDIEARHGRQVISEMTVKPIQQLPYPDPTYRGGGAQRSYWMDNSSGSEVADGRSEIGTGEPEPMSWRLVGDHTGRHYN